MKLTEKISLQIGKRRRSSLLRLWKKNCLAETDTAGHVYCWWWHNVNLSCFRPLSSRQSKWHHLHIFISEKWFWWHWKRRGTFYLHLANCTGRQRDIVRRWLWPNNSTKSPISFRSTFGQLLSLYFFRLIPSQSEFCIWVWAKGAVSRQRLSLLLLLLFNESTDWLDSVWQQLLINFPVTTVSRVGGVLRDCFLSHLTPSSFVIAVRYWGDTLLINKMRFWVQAKRNCVSENTGRVGRQGRSRRRSWLWANIQYKMSTLLIKKPTFSSCSSSAAAARIVHSMFNILY